MIKKEILNGRSIETVESSLSEMQTAINEHIYDATCIKQIFTTSMDNKGVALHSINLIETEYIEVERFNDNLIINTANQKFSIAINKECNVVIQRPEGGFYCELYFEDLQMWLMFK